MRRSLALLVIVCLWGSPVLAQGAEHLKAGIQHLQANRFEEARDQFTAALQSNWLVPAQRGMALSMRALCHSVLGDHKAARADLDQAIPLLKDPGVSLALRAGVAWRMNDNRQALQDLMRVSREFPNALRNIEPQLVRDLLRWLKSDNRMDDRFALLEAVVKAGYQPAKPGLRIDGLVSEYMGALIDRGSPDSALAWVERIINARQLIEMRVDGRFRPLWKKSAFNARTEPRAAAERERAYWKAEAGKHPDSLNIVFNRMQILRILGESEKALQLGEAVSRNPDAYETDKPYRAWVLNEQAYALRDLGRTEDAVALLTPLLERSVADEPYLVNQFINLGILFLLMGEPERALETVAKAKGRVSPYGQKWIDSTEACAFRRLGRLADTEAAMKRLETNPEENYAALSRALLCLNRVDDAVQLALVRLRDPDHRVGMLMNLQSYRKRSKRLPIARELMGRWEAVRTHPEVQAEARKHGRLLDLPLYSTYWGDV